VLGAVACSTMSGVTLAVTHLTAKGELGELLVVCSGALAAAYAALLISRRASVVTPPSMASRRHVAPSPALLANPLTASGAHRRTATGEQQAT
jgi:hypothetical protein